MGINFMKDGVNSYSVKLGVKVPENYIKGRLPISGFTAHNIGQVVYNNGINEGFFIEGEQPEGWIRGRVPGRHVGSGNPCYGKKLCSNGIIQKYFYPDQIPEGFEFGSKNSYINRHKITEVA